MKASKFNIVVTPEENPRFSILYNTFHDHRLVVENTRGPELENFFRKIAAKAPLTAEEEETAKTFLDMGILLPDEADERAIFDSWYVNKIQNVEGRLALIVVTTMACNLRCPYCFEKDQLDNSKYMSMETAERLVAWVKNQVLTKNIKVLDMMFFGGEPLMNKKLLYYVSESLAVFAKVYGCEYQAGMISNGVLMTPDVSRELRRVGLNWVKITLDGDQHVHDTTRITASGRGSFEQIWRNLEHMNDDLEPGEEPLILKLGGNFQDDTYDGFLPLLDRLATASFRPYIQQINIKPVQKISSSAEGGESNNPCDKVCFNEANTTKMIEVRAELQKRGLPALDGLNLGPCDFYRGDSFTVGMDGALYPCIAFVDNAKSAIGNVAETVVQMSHLRAHQKWLDAKPWTDDCYGCSFLPVCTGGCRATAQANGYSWNSTVCEKDYFKRISRALTQELLGIQIGEDPAEPAFAVLANPASLEGASFLAGTTEGRHPVLSAPA